MEVKESKNLMTEGTIWKKIIFFALPLSLENLLQQLYNTADSLIVGNFLGSNTPAAVSPSGDFTFLIVGFFNGIAIGAGVAIARHFGTRDIDDMQRAIHTAIAFGLVSGLILTVLDVLLAPWILIWVDIPTNVLPQLVTYSRIHSMGSPGFVMYNTFVGILQAVGDSRHPLNYLIISSVTNIMLDIVLIVVFHMGVGSMAPAMILSQFVNTFLCMNWLLRTKDSCRLSSYKICFHRDVLALIIRYDLPSGLQSSVIIIVGVVVQPSINGFGEMAIAGCGAYSKIGGLALLLITSFTMALTTFVGQNLGAYQYEYTKEGAKFDILYSMAIVEVTGIIIFLGAPPLAAVFNSGPQVIMFGTEKVRTLAMSFLLLAYSHYISATLYGTGKSMIPMIVMLLFWRVVRMTFLTVMAHFLNGIAAIYWVYPLTWSLSSIAFFLYHHKVNWMYAFEAA